MAKYSSVTISGYDSVPPVDDGTVSEANKIKWSTHKTKHGDPLKTAIEAINTNLVSAFDNGPSALTTSTTLAATHYGDFIQVSGSSVTLTLTDAATLLAGWYVYIKSTDSNNVTIARATGADTINGTAANVTLIGNGACLIFVNAAANGFVFVDYPTLSGNNDFTGTFTNGIGPNFVKNLALSATVASKALTVSLRTKQLTTPASAKEATTVTMTIASPCVVTDTGHTKVEGTEIVFTTTGALPTGLTAGTTYYVTAPGTNSYNVAAAVGGSAINTSGSQSGTHTATTPNAPVQITFRNRTLTLGDYSVRSITAATSIVIPNGATGGLGANEVGARYIYACNNPGGSVEVGFSGALFDESLVHTTVAISTGADSHNVLYTTNALSVVAVKLIGIIYITMGAVAGEWDNAPTATSPVLPLTGVKTLYVNTTAVGNVGAGTDDLMTYTLPAKTLDVDGRSIRIKEWGLTTNNANAKTLGAVFGSVSITYSLTVSIAGAWMVERIYTRTSSNNQDFTFKLDETVNTAALAAPKQSLQFSTATQTDTSDIVIKSTGAATSNNDIIQHGMIVELLN